MRMNWKRAGSSEAMTHKLPLLHATLALVIAGCGYSTRPPYDMNIRTVYVPMFESEVFRRGIEQELTEAVIKQIELTTPYKVVRSEQADTVLKGTIRAVTKRLRVDTPEDEPRLIQANLIVDVEWRDLRTGKVLSSGQVPVPDGFRIRGAADYAPELGQTMATARHQLAQRLAQQIVALMEEPW